jgi:hypothetical protein
MGIQCEDYRLLGFDICWWIGTSVSQEPGDSISRKVGYGGSGRFLHTIYICLLNFTPSHPTNL